MLQELLNLFIQSKIKWQLIKCFSKPTAMYGLQPASCVLAMESTNCPLMPKSHNLMAPLRSNSMFDGLMSKIKLKFMIEIIS